MGEFFQKGEYDVTEVEEKISHVRDQVCSEFFQGFNIDTKLKNPNCTSDSLNDQLMLLEHTMIYKLSREVFESMLSDFPESLQTRDFVSLLKSATKNKVIERMQDLQKQYADDPIKKDFLSECVKIFSQLDVNR